MNKIYEKYTIPSMPGSFSGLSGFLKNNKRIGQAGNVLKSIPAYTLHKPIRYTFNRSKTLVEGIDDQWQVDLVDVSNIAGSNSGYKFILTCIDVFSKYAWAVPMINKSSATTASAFEKIFKEERKPNLIYSDDGKEFKGECKRYLESLNIKIFITNTVNKAAVVERFNRTLKEKMYRYFTYKKSIKNKATHLHDKRYLDVLQDLVQSYNNSYHRSIKTTPNKVNKTNASTVFKNLYGYTKKDGDQTEVRVKFKKGDHVRVVKEKSIFEKGYTASWSKEIYIIDKIYIQVPVLYTLIDSKGSIKPGKYYTEQLQKVLISEDTKEIVEKEAPLPILENPIRQYILRERKK